MLIEGRVLSNFSRIKKEISGFLRRLYEQKALPIIRLQDGLGNKLSPEEALALECIPFLEEIKGGHLIL